MKFSFFFLPLIIFFPLISCSASKLITPEIKDIKIRSIKLNKQGKIELEINLKVFNPNSEYFLLTVTSMSIFKDEELIGHLKEKVKFNLVEKAESEVVFSVTIEDRNIVKSIYNFLVNKKTVIALRGVVIYHHAVKKFKFNFNEEKIINLQDLFF